MLNFPESPTEGMVFNPNPSSGVVDPYTPRQANFVYRSGVWTRPAGTALRFNKIVNSGMQISEQNGDAASATAAANTGGYYPADQWRVKWDLTGSGGTLYTARWNVIGATLPHNTVYYGIGAPATSLITGNYAYIQQYVEGTRVMDLRWGSVYAIPAVLRFLIHSGKVGGTYSVCVTNSTPVSRLFLAQFTVPANVWSTVVIPIPGDTTGTWAKTDDTGLIVNFVLATADTTGVLGWSATQAYGTAGQANGAQSDYIHIGAVGLYADPNSTGLPPPYQLDHVEDELQMCQRYWHRAYALHGNINLAAGPRGNKLNTSLQSATRGAATTGQAIIGTVRLYELSVAPNLSSIAVGTNHSFHDDLATATATGTTGVLGKTAQLLVDGVETGYIAVDSRLPI